MSVTLACQCGHLAYWKDTMLTGNECCDSVSSFNNGGGASLLARLIFSHDVGTLMTSGVMIWCSCADRWAAAGEGLMTWSDVNVLSCVSDDDDDDDDDVVIRIEWIPASPTGSEQIHNMMLRREEAEKHFQVPPTASSFQRRSAGWLMTQLLFTPRWRSGGIPWEGESDDINPLFHVRRQPSMFEAVGEERCLGEMSLLESPAGFTGTLWLSGGMMCFWLHRLNVDWWTSSRADRFDPDRFVSSVL